ncbi:bZIP transcription factor [Microvirga lotononidis]|uniref:Uncharacterized protein n=1 Tax=Microvirga lotononidis TaxID=864069 RepID=I4YZX8_9HYPH|nr:bZIP transcription factor [Microvirga lotononidis]EIM29520.1 hypothetical protein MicloDRAFT_00020010 [Microvirga lotononidis]WQO27169.1 bZIP transcription factor [Microvirga lotononidis]
MRAVPVTDINSATSLSLVSTVSGEHGSPCTKRIQELEERVARLRAELDDATAALELEKARTPVPGDFVRCPLTHFFGQVTRVTPRPNGRPWVEIVPYLGPNLPGHSSMDLFDSWELIDAPADEAAEGSARLPMIAPFMPRTTALLTSHSEEVEVEEALKQLWAPANRVTS